jgi:hypothetical protein
MKGFTAVKRKYYSERRKSCMVRPNKFRLYIIIVIAMLVTAGFATDYACACVGARQMAMGGTFVGVADDASSVYWNPAGIGMLDQPAFYVTSTINNRDTYNYDDFLVCVWPACGDFAIGLSLIREHLGELKGEGWYQAGDWFTCSVAKVVSDRFSIGANLRYERHSSRPEGEDSVGGSRLGLDIGLLYHVNSKLSMGCLLQDAGLTGLHWVDGKSEPVGINVRPGIGYRPNPHTLIAVDVYDLLGQASSSDASGRIGPSLRIGVERWLTSNVAARFGYYGIRRGEGAVTCGIGLNAGRYSIDYAYLDVATVPGQPGLGGTHQIGVTVRF